MLVSSIVNLLFFMMIFRCFHVSGVIWQLFPLIVFMLADWLLITITVPLLPIVVLTSASMITSEVIEMYPVELVVSVIVLYSSPRVICAILSHIESLWSVIVALSYFRQSNISYIPDEKIPCIFQSEIYEVTDCFIVDTGLTGTYNQYNIDTDVTIDSNHDNGTLLSNTKETGNARRVFNNNNIGTDGRDITSAFCLEFKIVSFTGRTDFNFYQSSPYTNISDVFNTNNSAIHDGCTVKIIHDGAKYTWYVDDVAVTGLINKPHEWNTGLFAFMIRPFANIKYRDFKVYPI